MLACLRSVRAWNTRVAANPAPSTSTKAQKRLIQYQRVPKEGRKQYYQDQRGHKAYYQSILRTQNWEQYLNPLPKHPARSAPLTPNESIQKALQQNLENQYTQHKFITDCEALQNAPVDVERATELMERIESSKVSPTCELVTALMKLSLKIDRPEKAVIYFTWGRENGAAPNVEVLLELLNYIKPKEDWNLITVKLNECIRPTYPDYWKSVHGEEDEETTSPTAGNLSDLLASLPSQTSKAPVSSVPPIVGSADPSGTVNWVKFVLDPLSHQSEAVTAFSANLGTLQKKELEKQDSMKKIVGYPLGDRQKRLAAEMKLASDSELQSISLTDSVVVSTVISELVYRKQIDQAVQSLAQVVGEGTLKLSPDAFLSLASYYRDQRNDEGVMNLLVMMMKGNIAPNIAFLNTLLEIHVLLENWAQAVQLWDQLPSFNLQANTQTINILLQMMVNAQASKNRPTTSVAKILKVAQVNDIAIGDAGITHLMTYGVLVNNFDSVINLFKRLKSPNPQAYSMYLRALQSTNQFSKFLSAFHQLEKNDVSLNWEILRTCMKACYSAGKPDIFLMSLKYGANKSNFRPTLFQFKPCIMRAIRFGFINHALELDVFRQDFLGDLPVSESYMHAFLSSSYIKALRPRFIPPRSLKESTHAGVTEASPPMPSQLLGATPSDEAERPQEYATDFVDEDYIQTWDATVRTWLKDRTQLGEADKRARAASDAHHNEQQTKRQSVEQEVLHRFVNRVKKETTTTTTTRL